MDYYFTRDIVNSEVTWYPIINHKRKTTFNFWGFFRESRIPFKIQQNEGTYKPLKRCIK